MVTTAGGTDDTVWRQREEDLSWKEIEEEVIIIDLLATRYLRLNSAGRVLWHRLQGGATRSQLAQDLSEHFDLGCDQAREDTETFLASLTELNLIRSAGEG